MKALILAGGTGSRLRPLTYTSAKQLIPIANKPIVFFGIEAIRDAGITDIGVIVGDTAREIEAALGDGSRWGVKITLIPQSAPLGLAHAVLTAADFLGDAPFLMFLGDNLIADGVTPMVQAFERDRPQALVLVTRVPDPQRFGVVEMRDGRVVRLVEKPKVPPSDLALVGIYLFDSTILTAARSIRPSARGELEITDAIQWLVDQGHRVDSQLVTGWWKDTGKPEDVLDANRLILDAIAGRVDGAVSEDSELSGRVVIEAGARVERSIIRGPAVIGANALIQDAYIGPYTSVGAGVQVISAEVENSILLDGCVVRDLSRRMDASLLGRNVSVARAVGRPAAMTLVLGDNSIARVLD